MDRPSGPPLGAATQSTGRPLAENGLSRPPPLNTVRRIPQDTMRHAPSNSSINSQNSIPAASQVVQLARDAMKSALEENQTKAAEASGVSNELKPGVTIDLSHKQIKAFPEEVVDIIKNELERYCLCRTFRSCRMQLTNFVIQACVIPQPNLRIPLEILRMYLLTIPKCSKQPDARVPTIRTYNMGKKK